MTEADFRGMDGETLDMAAFHLGLAPSNVVRGRRQLTWYTPLSEGRWQPHADLAQADAVIRALRTAGWSTEIGWYAPETFGQVLLVNSQRFHVVRWEDGGVIPMEAHALLLCAVLAVALGER